MEIVHKFRVVVVIPGCGATVIVVVVGHPL
jgi:hypothetical protein